MILPFLLHHANRRSKSPHFYAIKKKLLATYGKHAGYDVQFIEGKKCHSCGGTGVYNGYSQPQECYRCFDGWYKRPVWNILERVQFGRYTFHQPWQRAYTRPDISVPLIEGYIDHNSTRFGPYALAILYLFFEKDYLKRYYRETLGFRFYWWWPRNWPHTIVFLHKHGWKHTWLLMKGSLQTQFKKPTPYQTPAATDDLPF